MYDLNHIYKVGNLISKLREEKGFSQSELGSKLGVTNKAVSRWENGLGFPEITQFPLLAKVFGVTVDYLMTGDKKGVCIAGNILADIIKNIDYYPDMGLLTTIREIKMSVGGCVPNTAINLAKIDKTLPISVIGKVGKDAKAKVFPYRIHDLPDPDKLENLNWFVNRFGYKIRTSGSKTDVSKSLNKLLKEVHGTKEQNLIEMISLKAMQKAKYSTHNIGHYGLAFDYYTHFTSPIRRFPDMMVHRLLARYLGGGRSAQEAKYEDLCDHSSIMEQIAANAERASIKYKQVEFMGERMGQEFDGTISGVTEWGLYVEVNENKCEGMIPMRELDDDFYDFDEKAYCLTGRRYHKKYSLGDPVRIKVVRANLERKQLDFALVE